MLCCVIRWLGSVGFCQKLDVITDYSTLLSIKSITLCHPTSLMVLRSVSSVIQYVGEEPLPPDVRYFIDKLNYS